MLYKADIQAFWLPELLRNDLEWSFRGIKSIDQFWSFTETVLGDYLFNDENMLDAAGENVDIARLNEFSPESFSRGHKGRYYVGPIRFL